MRSILNATTWPKLRINALRRLPAGTPGKQRLARALLSDMRSRSDVVIEAASGAQFLIPQLAEPVGFHLLVDGCYEPETEAFIASRLSAGDTFIDVGANIGVFTVSAAHKVGDRGRVFAVEPSPTVFPYLEWNIRMNRLANVTPLNVAFSDTSGDAVPFYAAPADHFGMGSLAAQFSAQPCAVATKTLDDVLTENDVERVAVLKVDVEGHELGVFRGAQHLLSWACPPLIIFEFCDWAERRFADTVAGQAQELLMGFGFTVWTLSEYLAGGRALTEPRTDGSAMLVAARGA